MCKYVGEGGDDLEDTNNILDLMSMIDTKLQLTKEMEALEKQQTKKSNQQSKDKKSKNGESKGERKMPCRKHDGDHDRRDCPDNKNCRP
jgi:hypothetical protein